MGKIWQIIRSWCMVLIVWLDKHHGAVTAVATIALVIVTIRYVIFTKQLVVIQQRQIDEQKEEFVFVNRPKVWFNGLNGNLQRGIIELINVGNLPAQDLKVAWKIIRAADENVIETRPLPASNNDIASRDKLEISGEGSNLEQMQRKSMLFTCDFNSEDKVLFLVVVWKYKESSAGQYTYDSKAFLWNNMPETQGSYYWAMDNAIGSGHRIAINSFIPKLQKALDK